ncbi:formate dehydrogenase accessory protein FdhE [Undibacterium sp. SXout20W]|uniref:formate dehydrogenase accessory protein FdhE n=1 Tax=Undibacterium sp. SXout20W TaxID=3413051 RepID=UPI003BF05A4E
MVQRIIERGEIESLDHTALPRFHLPEGAAAVFAARAARLRDLADGKVAGIAFNPALSGYLELMREVTLAQSEIAQSLSEADLDMPDQKSLSLALDHMMPPLATQLKRPLMWSTILNALIEKLADHNNPEKAALNSVLQSLRDLIEENLEDLEDQANAVLAQRHEQVNPAQAPFIAAALQVLWTSRAAKLKQQQVPMLDTFTLCPVCGSHPVASLIRIGGQSQGYRYLTCGMCATQWHMVRVKCVSCEQNGKISYQGLDPVDAPEAAASPVNKANDPRKYVRAETCGDCHRYTKIFNQEHDYNAEPFVDDLATLTLDILVSEAGFDRGNINPLLWFGESE